MNPVNEYLGPFYEHIFSEFISRGWLRLLYGGADVGGYLAHHPQVDPLPNTGHNCNATQVLVLPQDWPLADRLIAEVRAVISNAEPRPSYYPHSEDRIA